MKLGSLFDGIGGFPLSAQRHGITPVWASEIEPAAVSITKRHFPDMKHLGDITKINGAEIEPVDIITFGSPCQDLSVAGKRAGLDGERSGLFGEAIRIIDEMRSNTNAEYPRFAIWENVPGALSSSNGLDFKAVLQSFANAEIPMPDSGRWAGAGMVRGGRCDIAWRIMDAQYWGVPQRRRRIFLVGYFGNKRSAETLFKPESLFRDFTPRGKTRQETAGRAGNGVDGANGLLVLNDQGGSRMEISEVVGTLRAEMHGNIPCVVAGNGFEDATVIRMRSGCEGGGKGGGQVPIICAAGFMAGQSEKAGSLGYQEEMSPTLRASNSGTNQAPSVCIGLDSEFNAIRDKIGTLRAHCSGGAEQWLCISTGQGNAEICEDIAPTLNCNHEQPYIAGSGYVVRRLTTVECERLQGFPDNWTALGHDDKPISDSKRYAAIGNSVAIPCVDYIMNNFF